MFLLKQVGFGLHLQIAYWVAEPNLESQLDKLFRPFPSHSDTATVTLQVGFEPTYHGLVYVLLNLSISHLYKNKMFLSTDLITFSN